MNFDILAALKSTPEGGVPDKMGMRVQEVVDAVYNSDVNKVKKLLTDEKMKPDAKDPHGMSPLMHAAADGQLEICEMLVGMGARINAKDDMGENAFMKACKNGEKPVIKYFLEYVGAHAPKRMGGGKSDAAAAEKRRLIEAKDDEGVTALMKTAEAGEITVVKYLLEEENASLEGKDDEFWNVLMWAALSGQTEICEMLIHDFQMPAQYQNEKGETPLMKAASMGHWEVCELLIQEKAKVNVCDSEYQSALMWAAAEGHLECVEGLVKNEAKMDVGTKKGHTPLMLAARYGRIDCARFLARKMDGKIDQLDEDGNNALMLSAQMANLEMAEALLDAGIDIEKHNQKGETICMLAAPRCDVEYMEYLLDRDADLWRQDAKGCTALDHAEGALNVPVVQLLRAKQDVIPKRSSSVAAIPLAK